jgi:hypothetical protein
VDVRDVRVVECSEDLGLALEARQAIGIRSQGLGQDLDGDLTFQVRIGRPVDLTHAASADWGDDFIGAKARAGREGQQAGLYERQPRRRD